MPMLPANAAASFTAEGEQHDRPDRRRESYRRSVAPTTSYPARASINAAAPLSTPPDIATNIFGAMAVCVRSKKISHARGEVNGARIFAGLPSGRPCASAFARKKSPGGPGLDGLRGFQFEI